MPKKLPDWAPTVIWGVSLFLCAWFLGDFVSAQIKNKMDTPREMVVIKKEAAQAAPVKTFADYQKDVLPMFGEAKVAAKPKKVETKKDKDEPVDESKPQVDWDSAISADGQIQLRGTLIGSDTGIAFVNIGGQDLSIRLGQELGSYKVDRIDKNAVYFSNGSVDKVIAMNLQGDLSPVMSSKPRIQKPAPTEGGPPGTETAEGNNELDSIVTSSGGKFLVDRQKFNGLLTPPSRLANDIKFIPNSKDGKAYGIKISYLKNNTFFGKVGLKSGDILINANKKDVNSVEDSFQVYQMFRNEDNLSLQVERDGQIVDIPIEFR
ncbi:MAG: hypothetical protein LWY06_08010 [Firmicutes bacterium]|nr:hypothetical protein [Bacillota bacterium]